MPSWLTRALAPILAGVLTGAISPSPAPSRSPLVFRDVRLFDGEHVSEHRTVVVEDGVISRVGGSELVVPSGTAVIDGQGRTLLPGLIDAHVHLSDSLELDLRQAASLGVTTVLDMWSGSARLERIKAITAADPPGMASVRTAGNGATAPGGHPSQMGGPPFPTIAEPTAASQFVDARIAEGSDYLKIVYDDLASLGRSLPMLDPRTLAGLIGAAHRRGMIAVVHIGTEEQARAAVEAGADGLVHLFASAAVAPSFAPLVARHRAFVAPTLTVLHGLLCGKPNGALVAADSLLRPYIRPSWLPMMTMPLGTQRQPRSCAGTDEAIRQLVRNQVPILAGTDSPVPGQTHGASLHGELALLASIGLTPLQVLAAATSAPAVAFRLADRGFIRPGLRADLVLVDGDPTTNILLTRRIVGVWTRGVAVERRRYQE